jgi:hypothetical protein
MHMTPGLTDQSCPQRLRPTASFTGISISYLQKSCQGGHLRCILLYSHFACSCNYRLTPAENWPNTVMSAHTQRYFVDGHIRTRTFQPEHHKDSSFKGPVRKPQQQRKTEVEEHHVNESSDPVRNLTNRKYLYALKEKILKRKKKAPKEKSANPSLLKILFLGGRWAHGEDVQPGLSNRTNYAAPNWGWRPLGGTR